MEDTQIVLERHEQKIQTIERDISDLKAVQSLFCTRATLTNCQLQFLPPMQRQKQSVGTVADRRWLQSTPIRVL